MRVPANTTFVVGAGASCPYGFPTGFDLKVQVTEALLKAAAQASIAEAIEKEVGSRDLRGFAAQLHRSNTRSVDEFVGRRPEWTAMAKVGIAANLLQCEKQREEGLNQVRTSSEGDWLRHLLNCVLADGIAGLHALRIVTFNFDRVIEHCLFDMLKAGYGYSESEAALAIARLGIVHVNGSLGRLPWQLGEGPIVRFGETGVPAAARAMASVQFVHEPRAQEAVERAAAMVREAGLVCFLGFGFHPDNIDALDLRATRKRANEPWLATGFGLTTAEAIELQMMFGGLEVYSKADALTLVRSAPQLHGYDGRTDSGWVRRDVEAAQAEMRGY